MPKKDEKVETISVPLSKAEAGLKLKPGHKTVIIIEDSGGPGATTTAAPGATTTAAPGATTTAAPGATTTAAPGATTTKAPGATTTAAPAATTTAPGPAATTTAPAPAATTTAAAPAATTTAPAPATTTTAPAATTTSAPATTTTAPATTTSAAPATTTSAAPATTTTAPAPTTTYSAPATTTTAPATTTSAAPATTTSAAPATTTSAAPATTTSAAPATTTSAAPATTTSKAPATTTSAAPAATTTKPPAATTTAPPATTTKPPVTPSAKGEFSAAHFETDKTLPLPAALPTFKAIAAFANKEPNRLYLVVGHTDGVGTASHNLGLSDERAKSIVAYLKNDVGTWMAFYEGASGQVSKKWGIREDQIMLHALPFGGDPFYKRDPSGVTNADFTKAIRDFQRAKKQPETGTMDKKTRSVLVAEYMAAEGTTVPDAAELQTIGCGLRHKIEKTDGDSPTNRRVDVFAFETKPVQPAPDECRNGKHPGCTVYEQWLAEVKQQIQ